MIFETIRRRKLMKIQFDYWLNEAKTAKVLYDEFVELDDQKWASKYSKRFDKAIEAAESWAREIGDTGGYGIVLQTKLKEQIEEVIRS